MLNKKHVELHELVWASAAIVGRSPPKIADDIIGRLFPRTFAEATIEGAESFLRSGLISEINRIVRSSGDDGEQQDFSDIDPTFRAVVKNLKSKAYMVPSLGEQVTVRALIANPAWLDEARRFMRQKGEECIAEAVNLDQLFAAVTEGR